MAWDVLRTGSFDWIKGWARQGGKSCESEENQDFGNWVSSMSEVAIDDDDELNVVGVGCEEAVGW